jgi:hypothetical protein
MVLLGLSCLVAVAGLVLNYLTLRIVLEIDSGFASPLLRLDRLEAAQALTNALGMPALLAAAVPFLIWLHRASGNARALGIENLPTSPGLAVGYWFIPLLNLIMPPKVVGDLLRASAAEAEPETWQDAEIPSWIILWWLLFVMAHFIGMVARTLESEATDLAGVELLIWADSARGLCWTVSGILAILIVREIDWRQRQRAALQGQVPGSDALDPAPASPQVGD